MIGYKLFRKRRDGSLGPLFINRSLRIYPGRTYQAEDHRTKGYAHRPGWHICHEPTAPHLRQGGDRVWCRVSFTHNKTLRRPASQGGTWYLGSTLRVLEQL